MFLKNNNEVKLKTKKEKKASIVIELKKGKKKYEINRSKGLGENEPEMMWHTTMCPETRRLVKVEPERKEKTKEMFNLMLGENLKVRKD